MENGIWYQFEIGANYAVDNLIRQYVIMMNVSLYTEWNSFFFFYFA